LSISSSTIHFEKWEMLRIELICRTKSGQRGGSVLEKAE